MDAPDPQVSPRKRLKVQSPSIDYSMEISADAPISPMADAAPAQDHSAAPPNKEAECGITEFVDLDRPSFSGILKKRYTDFLVNEILLSGEVVHLDDLKAPQKKKAKPAENSPTKAASPAEEAPDVPTAAPQPAQPSTEQTEEKIPRVLAEPDSVKRQKHRVFVRQTDEGVEEISKEDEIKASQEDGTTRHKVAGAKENLAPLEPAKVEHEQVESIPSPPKAPVPSTANDWQAYAGAPTENRGGSELSAENRKTLTAYFDSDTVEGILALYNCIINTPHRRSKDYGSVKSAAIIDRAVRTSIHQDLRRIFQSRLESATDDNGAVLITAATEKPNWNARAPNRNNNTREPQWNKPRWHELGGDFLHFTLYKENKDTMEAISWLAKQLQLQPKSFQFAGTKDRRGVTVQRISAYRVLADRMVHAGRTIRQAKVGNYEYQPHELRLGDLIGNEFVITLRDCQFGSDTTITKATKILEAAVSNLRSKGFLNYYGLQRFGTFAMRTDTIGIKMLQGDFRGAVDAILDFNPALLAPQDGPTTYDRVAEDDKARAYALNAFKETGKSHPALENLPRKFSAETAIIRHLSGRNQENDFQGALNSITRSLRLMYVHAYQSLVWNVMASERWKKHGDKVIEGDLVLISEHAGQTTTTTHLEEVDADGEPIVRPSSDDRARNADDAFVRARVLSKDEAESGNYTIFDIVLPTPGFDILYPENEIAGLYKDFMASDRGGGLDPYDMRRKWKDISLSGSYRKMMARPREGITFDVRAYVGDDEQFVETDLDRLTKGQKEVNGHQSRSDEVKENEQNGSEDSGTVVGEVDKKLAVILKMQLGSSQYATMALRELLGPGGLQAYKPDFGGGR